MRRSRSRGLRRSSAPADHRPCWDRGPRFDGCSATNVAASSCRGENLKIREAVIRHLVETYRELPPQVDDPVGRHYCLGFDFRVGKEGTAPPSAFLSRFSDQADIHGLEWCDQHKGRLLSVGPVGCEGATRAKAWSLSWIESRPGGTECLHTVVKTEEGWEVQEGCENGLIYG